LPTAIWLAASRPTRSAMKIVIVLDVGRIAMAILLILELLK